jgi:beta-phosphoglucomutase-like phosphatase (HAD superfamily)
MPQGPATRILEGNLARERETTARLLARTADSLHIRPTPWLSPVPVTCAMLGLPPNTQVCVFDLDGALSDSGALHAQAWREVFDDLLLYLSDRAGWPFIPFDPGADYAAYLDGRPRIEGIHAFLDSRGLHVPEGRVGDASSARTANGIARHKDEALGRLLAQRGVSAAEGARRYLEAIGRAGIKRAVVSASARTSSMLEAAGLAPLVEGCVDAGVIAHDHLRSRPAPDVLLAACSALDVAPGSAVTFTATPAGVAAGRVGGLHVVAVGHGSLREDLLAFGAESVVGKLSDLLDRRLRDTS